MLRFFVLFLLLLNVGFFTWEQGWLLGYGFGPSQQREPQRVAQQIRPEAVKITSARELDRSQVKAPPAGGACLESGLLDDTAADAVRRVLQSSMADQTWSLDEVAVSERWIIYMGKFANPAELAKKRAQLASLRLTFEPLSDSALAPGLSLGVFGSQAQANTALTELAQRGVRTARVVQETPPARGMRLRLPAVDEALQNQLPAVRAALVGQELVPCSSE